MEERIVIEVENGNEAVAQRRFIEYFIKIRKNMGLTQQNLADVSKIARANVARFEKGDISPTLETIIRLAGAMGKDIEIRLVDKKEEGSTDGCI